MQWASETMNLESLLMRITGQESKWVVQEGAIRVQWHGLLGIKRYVSCSSFPAQFLQHQCVSVSTCQRRTPNCLLL